MGDLLLRLDTFLMEKGLQERRTTTRGSGRERETGGRASSSLTLLDYFVEKEREEEGEREETGEGEKEDREEEENREEEEHKKKKLDMGLEFLEMIIQVLLLTKTKTTSFRRE